MQRIGFLLFLATSFLYSAPLIIGYYPNWQWYDRNKLVNPETIPYHKMDIINYAFFYPETSGIIKGTDDWADENLLKGEPNWSAGGYYPNTSLPDRVHAAGKKLLISLGGWSLSNNFPAMAASPAARRTFASQCKKLIREYKFDGIDIDWEYPGFAEHSGTPQDKQNFTLLLKDVRDTLNTYGNQTGKYYLLTAALPADPDKVNNIEVANIIPLLDYFNLMTYDFFGAWDNLSNHNSPLYAPAQGTTSFNISSAVQLYRSFGVPAAKINAGVAFYGRSFKNCSQLFGTHTGTDKETFPPEGTPLYYEIKDKTGQFTDYWDNLAKVPYGITDSNTLFSYDNEESIKLKAEYVKNNNMAGVIVWEITGDFLADSTTPLLDKLNSVFHPASSLDNKSLAENSSLIEAYPNPFNNSTVISFDLSEKYSSYLNIFNSSGSLVQVFSFQPGTGKARVNFNAHGLSTGLYYIRLTGGNRNVSHKILLIK